MMTFWYRVCWWICRIGLFFWHPVFHVVGRELVPAGKAVLSVNHSGCADAIWLLLALDAPQMCRIIAKKELTPLFLGDPNASIIIIAPQGEYKKLVDGLNKFSNKKECQILQVDTNSSLHFNPFDGDISRADFLSRKAEIAIVMMAEMIGVNGYLTGEQKSIVDQIVHSMFLDYEAKLTTDPRNAHMPTLKTFHEYLWGFFYF